MISRLITIVTTALILLLVSFGLAYIMNTAFIDVAFFAGLAVSVIIWFFTSRGGVTSRNTDMVVQSTTGTKMEQQKFEFSPNSVFYTSLAYTIITLAGMLFHYRNYFL